MSQITGDGASNPVKDGSLEEVNVFVPQRRSWFYNTFTQAIIIGLVAFLGPGMYNALSGLGAGGLASTDTWNKATALLFALLCVTCVFGGIFISQFGLRWSLALGACFYAIYAASLYENSRSGNEWFLILANALEGIGSGLFFATEGAVVIGYPEPSERGRYIYIWVFIRNLGPIVGGAILLGLNIKTNGSGYASLQSYAAFVGIMCGAPLISLLLAPPHKVQRDDDSKVVFHRTSFKAELRASCIFLTSRKILLLIPLFFSSWFYDSFMSNYTANYLSVRARALSSFLTPFDGNVGSIFIGWWLDSKIASRRKRALIAFAGIIILHNQYALWVWTCVNEAEFLDTLPTYDWSDEGFRHTYALILFWNLEGLAFQSFLYWLTGTLTHDLHELVHVTGILSGIEGAGQAVAYGIAGSNASKWIHVGLNMGLIAVSIYPAFLVIRDISDVETVVLRAVDKAGHEIEETREAEV
ncbi:major facilitator superfamily domain-containing protein [Mucidula mucida]|nr:major facilitator superfamily domain-containing protein [Mucidula mucida]